MSTIADVAREAGVSVSTVSHVVNGTRRVSPATASAVRAVIDAIDYRPNVVARSLKTASTRSVGIAISAIANPYFTDIICAIEAECARLDMMIFLSDTQDDPTRELQVLTALHQRRVDGIILAPSADPERRALRYLRTTRLPCVLVDRTPDPSFDQVGVNNREAMRELVDHVAALGHRAIGYIAGHPGFETTLERIIGYRSSLERLGLEFDERYLVTGAASTGGAAEAAHALMSLPDPPTAIVTGNNMATIGAMRAVRARGLSVPADISIAGFDDFEWADCFEPRLTLVAQPCEEIGRRAAFLLMERIAAPEGARRTVRLDAALEAARFLREAAMSGPAETAAPLLVMRGVTKHFGGVQALRGVDFDLKRGEIHALLGENGAGKSTLMNVLAGVFAPDAGEMLLDGQPVRFDDPRAAQAAGVATIFQELDLVPSLDVTANLFLGRELTRGGVLDRAAMRRQAIERLSVVGKDIGVDQPVGELSVGRRQIVAIAKALTYASKILIMDEPTAALTASEVERLFVVMREIAARGVGIVYISHRLEEVPRVADRVTVMRDGQVAGVQPANAPQSELVRLLVGRPLDELYPQARDDVRQAGAAAGSRPLSPRTPRPGWQAPEDVSLVVRAGEIVGLAGIMGAGRTELLTALYGAAGHGKWSGVVEIDGQPARLTSIRGARAEGLGLVTDDRRGSGLLIRDTVGRNMVLTVLERVSPRLPHVAPARERAGEARRSGPSTCARPGPRSSSARCRAATSRRW